MCHFIKMPLATYLISCNTFGIFFSHASSLYSLFILLQIIRSSEDSSGRILYESNSLVAVMLNQAVLAVKKFPLSGSNIPLKILVHAKTSSLVDHLCLSLAAIGTSKLCTDNLLCAASEGCIALWYLVDALENLSIKNKSWTFPLTTLHSHLLGQVNIRGCDTLPDIETDPEKVVVTVTRAFLNSEPVQVAMLYCLRQRIEKVLIATIQVCYASASFHSYV